MYRVHRGHDCLLRFSSNVYEPVAADRRRLKCLTRCYFSGRRSAPVLHNFDRNTWPTSILCRYELKESSYGKNDY